MEQNWRNQHFWYTLNIIWGILGWVGWEGTPNPKSLKRLLGAAPAPKEHPCSVCSLCSDPGAPQCPQYPQYSRFQCCEKWIWLWDILELSALVSAQPDDVTQGLGSVGLPLEKGQERGQGRAWPGWDCSSWDQPHSCSGMRIPAPLLNPAALHRNTAAFLPLLEKTLPHLIPGDQRLCRAV